jgi:2-succinyl-5-enolpyruvyl-6-hydroxy-3-cyclohexene-1-carboxylate synthase
VVHLTPSPFDSLARSTVNSAWGALTVEVLARLGVETFVVSPGSRSTPLTVAAARNSKVVAVPVLDERTAAFFALGLAKRTRKPVALICTSGSAVANYFPAVVEAAMSGTPLLILSADRPPELRACGSGQTIDQLKFFGDYARAFYEMALPELATEHLAYLRQTLVHALGQALYGNPGPVHLNFPFRDPLAPRSDGDAVIAEAVLEAAATVMTRPSEYVACGAHLDAVAVERLASHQYGLIVVGDINPREGDEAFADAVALLAQKLGWPVLSDVLNPLRGHAGATLNLITHYDALLRVDAAGELRSKTTAILQIGALPTSKLLRAWLTDLDAVSFLLAEGPSNRDPLHRVATVLRGDLQALAVNLPHSRADGGWVEGWVAAAASATARIDARMQALDLLFEGKVAWLLSRHIPVCSSVFLASSMSVRYAEYFWSAGNRGSSIFSNRGANGIDGTLGTALGVAQGGRPAFLLTGDLAFLHDSNALLLHQELKGSLTVVLINNHGGGIFEHLPVAELEGTFEPYFATPQAVDLAMLCRAHGVAHSRVCDWAELIHAIESSAAPGIRVFEVPTDRKADRVQLAEILAL